MDEQKEIIVFAAASLVVFLVLGCLVIFILLISQRKRFAQQQKMAELGRAFNEELFLAKLETKEQTLQHISTELHDNLGALASLIKINLLTISLDDIPKATEKIANTADLTRQLITDIKSLSVSLNSDRIARKGLYHAIATEIDRINKTGQFTATISLDKNLPVIDNDKAIILYRMLQEILNNMVKHSKASAITVQASFTQSILSFILSDDGVGFNYTAMLEQGDGSGLHNLQKRASMIGALLKTTSIPGKGTTTCIELTV